MTAPKINRLSSEIDLLPGWLQEVQERAALAMLSQAQNQIVRFAYFHGGEERTFYARMHCSPDMAVPRLTVFDGRTSAVVCQSVEDDWKIVDPRNCFRQMPCGNDEIDRAIWEADAKIKDSGTARRSGSAGHDD